MSAGIGVAALALGALSWRRIARSQAEAKERSRRDTELLDSMLLMLDRELGQRKGEGRDHRKKKKDEGYHG